MVSTMRLKMPIQFFYNTIMGPTSLTKVIVSIVTLTIILTIPKIPAILKIPTIPTMLTILTILTIPTILMTPMIPTIPTIPTIPATPTTPTTLTILMAPRKNLKRGAHNHGRRLWRLLQKLRGVIFVMRQQRLPKPLCLLRTRTKCVHLHLPWIMLLHQASSQLVSDSMRSMSRWNPTKPDVHQSLL